MKRETQEEYNRRLMGRSLSARDRIIVAAICVVCILLALCLGLGGMPRFF